MTKKTLAQITAMTPEARYDYLVAEVKEHKEIWTLQDQDGCVMLTTDEDDCIPMWPSEEAAALWAVDEWQDCEPLSIPLNEWLERWVAGMQDDDLQVAVFPVQEDLGVVVPPWELESRLQPKPRH
ncbi:DUF2750 domain-containing protein [Shewanella litorisediminis]|uniref:DUF2750 domain-containing protein n=1 Tax=Shewanella litorisediminis TaxID=1173586 RepID=A0ABX7G5Q0_9GAMM|nr:DUF2750 domain-containing protein [Shewanella litorisediminis]MCL2917462.1 DUF2750 domain-containing protein [Shewanella litorisediminis]QRH02593.1 DUF2750 domain-containing protein [Shewanella litorisediminis]